MAKGVFKSIMAYGDRLGDGVVQISFVLPVPFSPKSREAGRAYAAKLGLRDVAVATAEPAGDGNTFFVVYGHSPVVLDYGAIEVPVVENPVFSRERVNEIIRDRIGRKVVVAGACTGSDAHTVGIDAIMNMKGFAGDYGLERYPWIAAHNMGAQISNAEFLDRAVSAGADVLLLSQVVTQRDVHIDNASELVRLANERGVRERFVMIFGGPRVDHKLALSLGFDAGFGAGTTPSEVASYIVYTMVERMKGEKIKA
ncbi:MAG: cobalamin B12-binding domain-containing protein [Deltaproteobacteria bacterium]|nr:cobalamin B12-binding domain-containing protein [Deltaproteobacteria bacterium]